MEIENNDQRLVDLFIEDEKARIKQAVSEGFCRQRTIKERCRKRCQRIRIGS